MEISVYGRLTQRLMWIVLPLVFAPAIAVWLALSTTSRGNVPGDLVFVLAAVIAVAVLANLLVLLVLSVQIRIDPSEGKVLRFYRLLGRTFYQREYALADFDRVSLFRGGRGGYMARLVGRDSDILLCASGNLKRARQTAEEAAACCRLALNDQL